MTRPPWSTRLYSTNRQPRQRLRPTASEVRVACAAAAPPFRTPFTAQRFRQLQSLHELGFGILSGRFGGKPSAPQAYGTLTLIKLPAKTTIRVHRPNRRYDHAISWHWLTSAARARRQCYGQLLLFHQNPLRSIIEFMQSHDADFLRLWKKATQSQRRSAPTNIWFLVCRTHATCRQLIEPRIRRGGLPEPNPRNLLLQKMAGPNSAAWQDAGRARKHTISQLTIQNGREN